MTDNIKRFEYTLRRRLDANASQVFLSGTDDVPEQYASWSSSTTGRSRRVAASSRRLAVGSW